MANPALFNIENLVLGATSEFNSFAGKGGFRFQFFCSSFLTPDTRLRGRSRFVAAKARHLKPRNRVLWVRILYLSCGWTTSFSFKKMATRGVVR